MPTRDIVVLGGSAGAHAAVHETFSRLSAETAAAFFLVLHVDPAADEWLSSRISSYSALKVEAVFESRPIKPGTLYLPCPNHHLLIANNEVRSSAGPRENFWRPSIDVLFRSAAVECAERVIGVLLSGELDDGVDGLQTIKRRGGLAVVQDPSEASSPTLPSIALSDVDVDHRVNAREIASLLEKLINEDVARSPVPTALPRHTLIANNAVSQDRSLTELSCPDCGGPLWQSADQTHFQCLVGHRYHLDSLVCGSELQLEQTLWAAIRMFEQRARIARMMEAQQRERGRVKRADIHATSAKEALDYAETLRTLQATMVNSTERLREDH
jgi:two-component system, chemotaxis family, protein-glutamate methylesterase/glutaminase